MVHLAVLAQNLNSNIIGSYGLKLINYNPMANLCVTKMKKESNIAVTQGCDISVTAVLQHYLRVLLFATT